MTGGKWVYCIEKTKNQKAPHVHLIAVFPDSCGDIDAKKVIAAWFKWAMKSNLVPSIEIKMHGTHGPQRAGCATWRSVIAS